MEPLEWHSTNLYGLFFVLTKLEPISGIVIPFTLSLSVFYVIEVTENEKNPNSLRHKLKVH